MKHIFTLALLLFAISADAQVYAQGRFGKTVNINNQKDVKVCELLTIEDLDLPLSVYMSVDYGQVRIGGDDMITDADGNKMVFNSRVAAINHMEHNGWGFIDNSIIQKGRSVVYRFYFMKK